MGTIMTRAKKDGSKSYTATVRKKQKGKVIFTETETFPSKLSAERWIKNRESDLKDNGALVKAIQSKRRKTWSDVIADYCAASPNEFGKTKTANLAYLQRLDFGQIAVEGTDDHTFFKLGQDLHRGVQAPPADKDLDCPEHYELKPRKHFLYFLPEPHQQGAFRSLPFIVRNSSDFPAQFLNDNL